MLRFLREPLLHFAVVGGLLFLLYSVVNRQGTDDPKAIVVDQQRVAALIAEHQRVWQRVPTPEELKGLIDAWVRDEVFYREGVSTGLDRDDALVRRRVVQKMTLVAESMAADVPDEAALVAWFQAHAEQYRTEPSYTLRQLYFDAARHPEGIERAVAQAQLALAADPETKLGDPTLLPAQLRAASKGELARVFGDQFANAVVALPQGKWSQVPSSFGQHLVHLDKHERARLPKLDEVRKLVERDFAQARAKEALETFYRSARAQYEVRVDANHAEALTKLATSDAAKRDGT